MKHAANVSSRVDKILSRLYEKPLLSSVWEEAEVVMQEMPIRQDDESLIDWFERANMANLGRVLCLTRFDDNGVATMRLRDNPETRQALLDVKTALVHDNGEADLDEELWLYAADSGPGTQLPEIPFWSLNERLYVAMRTDGEEIEIRLEATYLREEYANRVMAIIGVDGETRE